MFTFDQNGCSRSPENALGGQQGNLLEQATIRTSEAHKRIPILPQSKTVQEFDERLGQFDGSYRTQQMEKEDTIAEFCALKIVCALAVYNQATEGEMLQAGMPSGKVRVVGKLGKTRITA